MVLTFIVFVKVKLKDIKLKLSTKTLTDEVSNTAYLLTMRRSPEYFLKEMRPGIQMNVTFIPKLE